MGYNTNDGAIGLSVLICTYNREDVLASCLKSLAEQTAPTTVFEVLIIDNNSTDKTAAIAADFVARYPHFHYFLEKQKGLSYARNRAYRESSSPWLLYLDDDARAESDLVEAALQLSTEYHYDMYGGIIYPWYRHGRPPWFRDHYAEQDRSSLRKVELQTDPKAYAKGCLMLLRRSMLDAHGDFALDLGMTGDKIAYGEEIEMQNRFRKTGAKLAFAPQLRIHHLVPPYKMRLDWFFQSGFALGRDLVPTNHIQPSYLNIISISLTAIVMCIVHLLWYSPRLLSSTYYFENWAIDVFRKVTKRIAMIHTLLLLKEKSKHEPGA